MAAARTHFDIFGLPPRYALDAAELDRRYRALSLRLHPDRAMGNRRQALEETAALNAAYQTLKDPVRRALYLLQLHGIELDRRTAPPELLEEVMSLREELEGHRERKDLARARKIAREVSRRRTAALEAAGSALSSEQFEESAEALVRVRYWDRLLEAVEAMEDGD
jgi:molecular chaperone HscB